MFLVALGARLLGNLLWDKGIKRSQTLSKKANIPRQRVMRRGKGTRIFGATSSFNKFWQKYQNGSKFKEVNSKNNSPKLKDGAYIVNLDE